MRHKYTKKRKYIKKNNKTRYNRRRVSQCNYKTSKGGSMSGITDINVGFYAPVLGTIANDNSGKFEKYTGDKLTSIVNMTHNTPSIKNMFDNIDERLALILYGNKHKTYPTPIYKKNISIQVPQSISVSSTKK